MFKYPLCAGLCGLLCAGLLSACAPQPPLPSPGHLNQDSEPPPPTVLGNSAPPPISETPYLPPPQPVKEVERYTVVVDQVPIKELLFALARDASLNVDIDPRIKGVVTINAVDQTLPQILERIARQVDLRYALEKGSLSITLDLPYVQSYRVDYVNIRRESKGDFAVSTQIAGVSATNATATQGATQGGSTQGGTNNSSTSISNISLNHFWETLEANIRAILVGEERITTTKTQDTATGPTTTTVDSVVANNVMANPESGIITVRATARQQAEIQNFLDKVMQSVQRQVLIEATIVEIQLNDQYQAGIDWQRISGGSSYTQQVTGSNLGSAPVYTFAYSNPASALGNIAASLKLLERYGTTKVLSSPKIMALNNQPAVLRVVDNQVYFTINIQETDATNTTARRVTYESKPNTVPEGLIMSITPQISSSDSVTLNVRPTISRIVGYVKDPSPSLASFNIVNQIPVLQVREIESILKVDSGHIAVIGGLMQDSLRQGSDAVPGVSKLPLVGDLFNYRDDKYVKSELVIFLRPLVIKDANLNGDFKDYRRYLNNPAQPDRNPPTGLPLNPAVLYPSVPLP